MEVLPDVCGCKHEYVDVDETFVPFFPPSRGVSDHSGRLSTI